ncbi:antibiotic biosynthesis monooxygenase [Mycolicibacterium peregrinum]|uniref:putative quinol monooxygenase n=1 Tax=Mycolicibacterium peregrinum TaxID=43304 RepID=UPI0007E9E241|nr:putative quinol monooxygenase [Mycolicibacterium peregrinum]OBF44284.1 antibiotic biosynthesis monooxygenase [Mycolicibacterium peregrinum]
MHTAFIRVKVAPEAAQRAATAMQNLVDPTLAEPGCITYEFYRDLEDPSLFLCFEHWDSRESMDAHGTTPHVATFLTELGPSIEKWEYNHTAAL